MKRVQQLLERISFELFSTKFEIKCFKDKKFGSRVYLQVIYVAKDKNTKDYEEWLGRKWYLSEHMLDDEIVKTAYAACKSAVEHEIMESFKVDGKILFNPHTPFDVLLGVSDIEVKRTNPEYLFETYKQALDERCHEGCFYMCSQGGQLKPNCLFQDETKHFAESWKDFFAQESAIELLEETYISDEEPTYRSVDSLWEEFFKWKEHERKRYLDYLNKPRKTGKGWYNMIQEELPAPNTAEAIISRSTENKNPVDLKLLNERLDVLNKKKQDLLSLKKEFRKELPEVLESIQIVKNWIKQIEMM